MRAAARREGPEPAGVGNFAHFAPQQLQVRRSNRSPRDVRGTSAAPAIHAVTVVQRHGPRLQLVTGTATDAPAGDLPQAGRRVKVRGNWSGRNRWLSHEVGDSVV